MKVNYRIFIYSFVKMGVLLLLVSSCTKNNYITPSGSKVTDIDGNVYKTVTIGTQVWMGENLKVTKYRNGDEIPIVTNNGPWSNLTTGAYCNYNNDSDTKYSTTYGKLYNSYVVSDGRNVAPEGWHVPSDAEWTILENYLITNGYNYNGKTEGNGIAKSMASTNLWIPSTLAGAAGNTDYASFRNKSGFTALPGGLRLGDGEFSDIGTYGYWWSSTVKYVGTYSAGTYLRGIGYDYSNLFSDNNENWEIGISIRCLKD